MLDSKRNIIGQHLVMDGRSRSKEKLGSMEFIYKFLFSLPDKIGMKKIGEPYVHIYDDPKYPEKWGVSGIVIIVESHISIHTWPEANLFSLDIFSCKSFDVDRIIKYLENDLDLYEYDIRLLDRMVED